MRAGAPPVFILSFRSRDELAAMTERCGWMAIGGRRMEAAERRFLASGAAVAVVDGRGSLEEGCAGVKALADAAEANGAALLALVSAADVGAIAGLHDAGATHYLVEPFDEAEYGQALRFAERHAARVVGRAWARRSRAAETGALTWSWRPGADRVLLSPVLVGMAGAGPAEQSLRTVGRLLGRSGLRAARKAIGEMLTAGAPGRFVHDGDGVRVVHHLGLADDMVHGRIEELDDADGRLPVEARDPLTGLADGAAARRWIVRAVQAAPGGGVALLMLAVSRFEMLNAAFGRDVGDTLLRIAARRIERLAGQGQRLVARIAGAEFAVGIPAPATPEEAEIIGRALIDAVSRPFAAGEHVVTLAAHIGVAVAEPGDDMAALLRRASGALAEAKIGEGGPVRMLSARDEAAVSTATQLEVDLRQALTQDEIELLYQPQISVTTGRIVGVEALSRWRHPRLGELGAGTLFAAAERSDYMIQLSRHVQRQVVAEVAAWPETLSELRVAINITAVEMALPGFAEQFLAMLDDGGLDRRRVTVEVTESGLIEDLSLASELLAALRAGGLRVAIDDFGTGYSSLAYLKALPLDYLKIDKQLAQDIVGSVRDRVVVRGVIDMARSLGLAVIAEGVETTQQLSLLAQEGCNFYQGYIFAPPLGTQALETMVSGWQVATSAHD